MEVLSPLQTGILHQTYSYFGRNYLCVSVLWAFRLTDGIPQLQTDMWKALAPALKDGHTFERGMPKERGEWLCIGSFHAPDEEPVRQGTVSIRVGTSQKKLLVSGPRSWRAGVPTRAEPITTLPASYREAFGGPGFSANPAGKGYAVDPDSGAQPLPCLEYPDQAVTSPSSTPAPGSLEGTDIGWPHRQRLAGTYDDNYLRTRMPGLPDDVDWRVFNEAAADQWIQGFFTGSETFEIINMHPEMPRIKGSLPGVRARAFLRRRKGAGESASAPIVEPTLSLDTVWFMPDADLGVLVHRGSIHVEEDDARDIDVVLAGHEGMNDPARSREHYERELEKRADPEDGFRYMFDTRPLLPLGCACALQELVAAGGADTDDPMNSNIQRFTDNQVASAREQMDETLARTQSSLGERDVAQDIPAEPVHTIDDSLQQARIAAAEGATPGNPLQDREKDELEELVERIAPRDEAGNIDLQRIDFDAMDEFDAIAQTRIEEATAEAQTRIREQIQELSKRNDPEQPELTRAIEQLEQVLATWNDPKPLTRPNLDIDLQMFEEEIDRVDQEMLRMREAGVEEQRIREQIPDLDEVRGYIDTARAQAMEAYRESAHYIGEVTSPHPGEEESRRVALLAGNPSSLREDQDYAFIDLSGCTLSDLDLSGAFLEYVDFTGARLVNVNLTDAVLAYARLHQCHFENVTLVRANLGSTSVEDTTFSGCDFSEGIWSRADIRSTRFRECTFAEREEMFLETAFTSVEFLDCFMQDANFLERDLSDTSFQGSNLYDSQFLQCDLTRCDFSRADARKVSFIQSRLPGARFDKARLDDAAFIGEPQLNDASFREASASRVNLREADLVGTDFTAAILVETDFSEAILTDARMDRVRARGAQFVKAQLGGASLRKADLCEASLMKANLVRTQFSGANLYSVSFLFSTLGETNFSGANLDNTILRDWRPTDG